MELTLSIHIIGETALMNDIPLRFLNSAIKRKVEMRQTDYILRYGVGEI